jgi:hypothetical protein
MAYSRSKDRLFSVALVVVCLIPVAVIIAYAYAAIHFVMKFW